ncbi:MAG: NUDIX hydrolase [Acidimicrobiales bacterium]|nr:NUDIX hydrolase [Acidimicrobiales bacterium]MDP6894674.1 NUDIX hydrolase [Acidimicrobiales bacterium]HJM38374.1 NUDIX hydrolase [Acidimicrobiales bacterium]
MNNLDPWISRNDIETDDIPILPAATMILLDDRPDLQVLMLLRNDSSGFVASHTIFPGGAIEQDDRSSTWDDLISGLTNEEADEQLRTEEARSYWIAAIRETIEEVGVVIGSDEEGLLEDRKTLENGTANFSQIISQRALSLDLSAVKPISRWITPKGGSRRYDTYFFVARSRSSVIPRVDGKEAVEVFWITPSEALQKWELGELTMISPTLATLKQLQTYRNTDEIFSVLDSKPLPENIRIIDESKALPLFPNDENYEASYTWPALGWTWLPKKAQ